MPAAFATVGVVRRAPCLWRLQARVLKRRRTDPIPVRWRIGMVFFVSPVSQSSGTQNRDRSRMSDSSGLPGPRRGVTTRPAKWTQVARCRPANVVGSGRIAQLARALPRHGRGPRFKSVYAHHRNPLPLQGIRCCQAYWPAVVSSGFRPCVGAPSDGPPACEITRGGVCLFVSPCERQTADYLFPDRVDGTGQNMPLSFLDSLGTSCRTSQCSTTLP